MQLVSLLSSEPWASHSSSPSGCTQLKGRRFSVPVLPGSGLTHSCDSGAPGLRGAQVFRSGRGLLPEGRSN